MASLTKRGDSRIIQYTDPAGKRRTVSLGKVPVKAAEQFRHRIEELIASHRLGVSPSPEIAGWVASLPESIHAKLELGGLVRPRTPKSSATVRGLCELVRERSNARESTLLVYDQAARSLEAFFGAHHPIAAITAEDADRFRAYLAHPDQRLARATQSKRAQVSRTMFARAIRWGMLPTNPFEGIETGSQRNPDRMRYIDPLTFAKVLEACPDPKWRAILALARYAGLRCPSEIAPIEWGDVDLDAGRLTIHSQKTDATRVVPIDPRLARVLRTLPQAGPQLIPNSGKSVNYRQQAHRIIRAAGLEPWPRVMQNLRASCECDWVERFPHHVAASWLGHSPQVASEHYLMTRDMHFMEAAGLQRAAVEPESAADPLQPALQNCTLPVTAGECTHPQFPPQMLDLPGVTHDNSVICSSVQFGRIAPAGLRETPKNPGESGGL